MNPRIFVSMLAIAATLAWRAEGQPRGTDEADTNFFPVLCCSNRTYHNATIEKVTPATATIFWDGGGERIPFTNLPPEIQDRYSNPAEAQKYLLNEAAAAVARKTLGPAQKIRILNLIWKDQYQIEAGGKVVRACIFNLPADILAFLNEITQTKLKISDLNAQLALDLAAANQPTGGGGRASSDDQQVAATAMLANINAAAAATAVAEASRRALQERIALSQLTSRLDDLKANFKTRATILACPSGYMLNGITRQWEFQEMATPGLSPEKYASMQTDMSVIHTNYLPIAGAFGWRLGDSPALVQGGRTNGALVNTYDTDGLFTRITVESLEDHRIFQIGGRAFSMTITAAHEAFEKIEDGLADKYGPAFAEGIETPPIHFWKGALNAAQWAKFSDGKSEIDLSRSIVDSEGRCSMEIDYVALDLIKQAAQEDPVRKSLMKDL